MQIVVSAEELKEMPLGTEFFCRLRGTKVRGDVWKTIRKAGAVVMENKDTGTLRTIKNRYPYEYVLCKR